MNAAAPIGIFDSGVGGLSVWREIERALPHESLVYVADQAHLPYGPRPSGEVRAFTEEIARWLLARGCKAVVVACNTASAAALKFLREAHPQVLFVGMEPAVKPAASQTRTRVVGVMATPGTLQGRMFALAVERFASGVTLVNQPCPGLVERIEAGELDTPGTEALLRELLQPILGAGADTLVLACTHYPFVAPLIRRIAGERLQIVDPAPAVARHLARSLAERGLSGTPGVAQHEFRTTSDPGTFARTIAQLLGVAHAAAPLRWQGAALDAPAQAA
ncbi:MAG TPA: glutamate racemase [Candidatus Binatia bacterium]|nr:glutamate racemase [Candidatus Binatia bacterium]